MNLDLVKRQAFKLVSAFEGRGYVNLTGNSDGMGVSHGMFQQNLGQGTLQRMLLRYYQADSAAFKAACQVMVQGKTSDLTNDLMALARRSPKDAVAWAAERMDPKNKGRFAPEYLHWVAVFRNLGNHPTFQAVQREFAEPYWRDALDDAKFYGVLTEIGIAMCFDTSIQNGQGKIGRAQQGNAAHKLFLDLGGFRQGQSDRLLALGQAVAATARIDQKAKDPKWIRNDVLSRRYAIACGCGQRHQAYGGLEVARCGVVHGRRYFIERDYQLRHVPVHCC